MQHVSWKTWENFRGNCFFIFFDRTENVPTEKLPPSTCHILHSKALHPKTAWYAPIDACILDASCKGTENYWDFFGGPLLNLADLFDVPFR